MGKRSKRKGAKGELEVAHWLTAIVERVALRCGVLADPVRRTTYMQANKGGDDLCGVEWASIEVKRHEKVPPGKMREWWAQACGQATLGRTPILLWRKNNQSWRARVRVYGEQAIEMDQVQFEEWFERTHEWWLTERLRLA